MESRCDAELKFSVVVEGSRSSPVPEEFEINCKSSMNKVLLTTAVNPALEDIRQRASTGLAADW